MANNIERITYDKEHQIHTVGYRILITSPIRQKSYCLDRFLEGIYNLDYPRRLISIYFLEGDSTDDSLDKLVKWKEKHMDEYNSVIIEKYDWDDNRNKYKIHTWTDSHLIQLAHIRDRCLEQLDKEDFVFMVDADVELHPQTLKKLLIMGEHVVTTLLYSKWLGRESFPNIGWVDEDNPYECFWYPKEFIEKSPSFPVGVLMAIWLIRRDVIDAGIRFYENDIENKEMEFKVFSKLCRKKNIMQWVNTTYPAKHIEMNE